MGPHIANSDKEKITPILSPAGQLDFATWRSQLLVASDKSWPGNPSPHSKPRYRYRYERNAPMDRVRHMQGAYCGAKMRTRWKQPNYLSGNALGKYVPCGKRMRLSVLTDMEICHLL